jgi:hypothetical protein
MKCCAEFEECEELEHWEAKGTWHVLGCCHNCYVLTLRFCPFCGHSLAKADVPALNADH